MTSVFADTFYFLGILNRADQAYDACRRFAAEFEGRLFTTDYVLLELADGLASQNYRLRAARFIRQLRASPSVTTIAASERLFFQALQLYESRSDKDWSLTDCASFVVTREHNLTDAVIGDRHFEQAGFRALLA